MVTQSPFHPQREEFSDYLYWRVQPPITIGYGHILFFMFRVKYCLWTQIIGVLGACNRQTNQLLADPITHSCPSTRSDDEEFDDALSPRREDSSTKPGNGP